MRVNCLTSDEERFEPVDLHDLLDDSGHAHAFEVMSRGSMLSRGPRTDSQIRGDGGKNDHAGRDLPSPNSSPLLRLASSHAGHLTLIQPVERPDR